MLTDDEIDRIWCNSNPTNFEAKSFARSIIAAYQAKLRHGVELPEPRGKVAHEERPYEPAWISSEDAYDIGQLQQYGDARASVAEQRGIQAGYLRGLEDAKQAAVFACEVGDVIPIVAAIGKLKGGE